MVVFAGSCTRCHKTLTWADLTQELWCLDAKNADTFGGCGRGVSVDRHSFDQECDQCAQEDEGVEVDFPAETSKASRSKRSKDQDDRKRKKQKT